MATPDPAEVVEGSVILSRRIGRGIALFVAADLGRHYAASGPHALSREIIARLLSQRVTPPFTTNAPPNVTVNLWRRENRAVLHLLNTPSDLLRLPGGNNVAPPIAPEDFVSTAPIRIEIPSRWKNGFTPGSAERLKVETNEGGALVTLTRLDRHAVVVLEE
ncbi:MAG: hypothetical protein ACLFWL_10560 [Candidatus Brocadiia bacterium]